MTPHLLCLLLTLTPNASADEVPWAGVPLSALPDLDIGEPHLDLMHSGWQAALPDGFVRVAIYPSDTQAIEAFAIQAATASTVVLPALVLPEADQAVGDLDDFLIVRSRNVVVLVRDRDAHARQTTVDLIKALVVEAPPAPPRVKIMDGETLSWDSCGRLTHNRPTQAHSLDTESDPD